MKGAAFSFLFLGSASAVCPNSCSFAGSCGQFDQCTCYANYRGSDCSQRICPFGNAWMTTPKGDLNFDTDRNDYTVYNPDVAIASGTASSTLITQEGPGGDWESWPAHARAGEAHFYMECSNRGLCQRDTGLCACFPGYEGYACNRMVCPNDCSGKGVCQSTKYLTENPSTTTSAWYDQAVSAQDYKLWDGEMAMACKCDPGYGGPDCSVRQCPIGDDILTQVDQVYETQFVDVYSTCEGQDAGTNTACGTASATTVLGGAITITYTDHFGEEYTTGPIDGVKSFGGDPAHALATNAEAALRALPNNVLPPTVTVKATYCDMHDPSKYGLTGAGVTSDGTSATLATLRYRGTGPHATRYFGGAVLDKDGKVIVPSDAAAFCTQRDTDAVDGVKADGTPEAGCTDCCTTAGTGAVKEATNAPGNTPYALPFSAIATLDNPHCIRLAVHFDGVPGDLPDLKINVDQVTFNGKTTAQEENTFITSSVTDTLPFAVDALLTYLAPTVVTTGDVAASTVVGSTVTLGSGTYNAPTDDASRKLTFYPETVVEIFCGSPGRSLGRYTIASYESTGQIFTLKETIPASTTTSSGCTSTIVKMESRSHVVVTGVATGPFGGTADGKADTGLNVAAALTQYTQSSSQSLRMSAKVSLTNIFANAVGQLDFHSTVSAGHDVILDCGGDCAAATAGNSIMILDSDSMFSAGNNKVDSAVGSLVGTTDTTAAALINEAAEADLQGATAAKYILNGKGTREASECGARGLCDSEAGECKCFPGYIGLSCSTQASIAF